MYDKTTTYGVDRGCHEAHDAASYLESGCACCADALPELFKQSGVDLARQALTFGADARNLRMPPAAGQAPVLLVNARIQTMDDADTRADALLVRDGRIEWVGNAAAAPAVDDGTVLIDCQDRTVLPGFIEPHMHMTAIAALRQFENVGPFRCPTVAGALASLARVAASTGPDEWIMGRQFDPSLQEGPGELTCDMLDQVSTTQPVFVYNASLHFGYCNSKALELAGITRETPDPAGSPFGRYADGTPNGVLKGGVCMGMVARHNPGAGNLDMVSACLEVLQHANSVGFTTVCDQGAGAMQGAKELALFQALRASNRMTARYRYSLMHWAAADWDQAGVTFGAGDEWLRASGWKIVSDGSNQGLSGLQRERFLCADSLGIAYIEPAALNAAVAERLAQGWPVVVHANGDRAIDNTLDAFAAARASGLDPAAQRCRIEHCSILHDDQIERIADLGLSPSFLIGHVYWWGKAFRDEIFGPEKAALLDRTGACEARGVRWTLHSDEPVTEMGPLRCIENAVTRTLWRTDGEVLAEHECVPVAAALRAMTRDAAWQCHSDHEIGSLEPGKFADFVVLDADPREVAPNAIGRIKVLETWVAGECVHRA